MVGGSREPRAGPEPRRRDTRPTLREIRQGAPPRGARTIPSNTDRERSSLPPDAARRQDRAARRRSSQGLGRERRVRSRSEFQRIQREGRRVTTPSFVLLLAAREADGAAARLGITASKRVGNAVVRNRVKRVVREAFRRSGTLFEPDLDVVVIARAAAAALQPAQVLDEWRAAQRRLLKAARSAREDSKRSAAPAPSGADDAPSP